MVIRCDLTGVSPTVTGWAAEVATEMLYARTGMRFGTCSLKVRPCRRECWDVPYTNWWDWGTWPRPMNYAGVWYNLACAECTVGCSCTSISEAFLPAPVTNVTEVKIDGAVLNSSLYRVDEWRKLVRLGGGFWPICNDLGKPDTEVGTWSVTFDIGEPVPRLGQLAAGELFCELIQLDSAKCKLPRPVQQIVRQGVTMTFADPNADFTDWRIGLTMCDLFINTYNPDRLRQRAVVYDVDREPYRITGTSNAPA
jgi:hypothetical protein